MRPTGKLERLGLSMLAQWVISHADIAEFAIGDGFAVTGEEKAGGGQVGGSFIFLKL